MKKLLTLFAILLVTSCSKDELEINTNNTPINQTNPVVIIDYTQPPTQAELNSLPVWTEIPDPALEQVLVDKGLDNVLDGRVLTSNISTITGYESPDGTVMGQYARMFEHKNIQNTTGIENFIGLQFISFWDNPITTINVSSLKRLKILGLSECPIDGTVDISQNLQLVELNFQHNSDRADDPTYPYGKTLGLTSLDVSNNHKLERIYLACNRISFLNISHLSKLTDLWAQHNPIQSLNLSTNSKLNVIVLEGCSLNYLNIKGTARNGVPRTCITFNNPNLYQIKVDNVAAINAWRASFPNPGIPTTVADVWYKKDPHTIYVE
jgi:hypothetical protein